MAHFLEFYLDALSPDACADIISRFDRDPHVFSSRTANSANPKVRSGTMLAIGDLPHWSDVAAQLADTLQQKLRDYVAKYPALQYLAQPDQSEVTAPVIERIEPGQGYDWHIDAGPAQTHDRLLSFLIYLRDVDSGGHTEFPFQEIAVKPKAGALLIFPPFWTHLHRGAPPVSNTKYNITSYLVLRPRRMPNPAAAADSYSIEPVA